MAIHNLFIFLAYRHVVNHKSRFGRKDFSAVNPWVLHLVRLFFQASFPHAASFPYYCNLPGNKNGNFEDDFLLPNIRVLNMDIWDRYKLFHSMKDSTEVKSSPKRLGDVQ